MMHKHPKFNDPVSCPNCGWEGQHWETTSKELYESFRGLAGREGKSFHCPVCDEKLYEWIWKIS